MERIPWQIVELHLNDVLYLPLIPHSSIQEKGNEGAKSICIRNEQCGLLLKQIQENRKPVEGIVCWFAWLFIPVI